MISREGEPAVFLDVPRISEKTSNVKLKEWSTDRWKSGTSGYVALDVINNGKELLLESNVDWKLVISKIRAQRMDTVYYGDAAIAANGARFIGGLAARAGWSMHDPQSVYLSGKYLAHIAGGKLEDFKTAMTLASVSYAEKTIPEAELLMKTLDLLLEHSDKRNRSNLLSKIAILLHDGKIQDSYNMISSREDFVRRRG